MVRIWLRIAGGFLVVFLAFLFAARAAEPSVRPVLYEARPLLTTTTTLVPVTTLAPVTTTTPIDEVAVLSSSYKWGPNKEVVTLQEVLNIDADGWYGPATRSLHIDENQKRGLSLDGIPPVPTTTTTTTTTTVPPSEVQDTVVTSVPIPVVTTPPISVTPSFGGMGAALVAQLLGQPCIADGDLSDCPPEVGILVTGLVGG